LIAISPTLFSQGNFSAKASGDWDNASTWNLDSGSDADGIPDADDSVSVVDFSVYVYDAQSANNLYLAGETINSRVWIDGGDLTILNNATIANSSTITKSSWITMRSGNLTITNNVYHTNPLGGQYGGFQFDNRAPFEGLEKNVTIGGNLTNAYSHQFNYQILGTVTNSVTLNLNGGSTQYINGERLIGQREYAILRITNGTQLQFWANSKAPLISDSLLVEDGSIYLDKVSLIEVDEFEHQITVASGSKITVVDDIPFPDHQDAGATGFVTDMQAGSTTEFIIGDGYDVNVLGEDFNYRDVVFKGVGTKTITNDIKTGAASVNDLILEAGILIVDASVTDISGITGTLTVKDGATLRIMGNPNMPAVNKFNLEEGSKVEYASNSPQNVLGALDYWHIGFDGTGTKTTSSAFSFQGEMSFSSDVSTIEIDHNITIQSDINNTGFISEVPSGYTFDYTGGGQFICERFFKTPAMNYFNASENYRDFSLPLISTDATLSQFDDDNGIAGPNYFSTLSEFPIFGVPDSKYPGTGSSNVSAFLSDRGAFDVPVSYNNSIASVNGSGKITTNAVRFGWGSSAGQTLVVRGELNTHDVGFNAQANIFFGQTYRYNLFGNPYPCAIDFEEIVADNANFVSSGNGISQTFYVIGPDEFGDNVMGFYNAFTNTGDASSVIPSYQGFMLEVTGTAPFSYDFTISESHKVAQDAETYKSSNNEPAPELMSIKVFENNSVKDKIHFYFFEGGTNSYEEVLDVKKVEPKVTALQGAKLDFYDGKKKLKLIANATTDKKDLNLQFVVENPDANNIALELTNLSNLLNIYNCIYVENVRTGETHSVNGDFLTINVGTVIEETFIIKSVSAPELFSINTVDATCHGFEDGLIRVDMSNLPENTPVTVFKNNLEIDAFVSNETSVYKRNVGAGNYEFRISGISELCTYVYREEIKEAPEVISNFEISDSLYTDKEIVFTSTANNATVNEWFTSTNETFYGDDLKMTYATPGKYWVKLTAIGNYENCKDEELKFFEVLASETSVGITENDTFFSEVIISTQEEQLTISNLPNNTKVELINNVGQILQSNDENNGIVIFAPLNNASYIIRLTNNDEVQSYHIGL
tara:strand:+ start:179770 stop:183084 length:3315 start_codon:yes stop_codon:yes gene_type:complete